MTAQNVNDVAYRPSAMYFHDSDCVEYTQVDAFVIYDRIDEFLTMIYDKSGEKLVGFKLKGFRNLFTQKLNPIYRLNDRQFLQLASAIEAVCVEIGEDLCKDEIRESHYRAARALAVNDNVCLLDNSLPIAA